MSYSQDEIEQIFIAGLLSHPEHYLTVCDSVSEESISGDLARATYKEIGKQVRAGSAVSEVTVVLALGNAEAEWVRSTCNNVIGMALPMAAEIAERARKARLSAGLKDISAQLNTLPADFVLPDLIALHERENVGPKKSADSRAVIGRYRKAVEDNKSGRTRGYRAHFTALDRDYIGYRPGQLWAVGGWTSTGKTQWAIEAMTRLMQNDPGARVAMVSTEMTEDQVMARIIANLSGEGSHRILNGKVDVSRQEDWLCCCNLCVWDYLYEMGEIDSALRREKAKNGLDLVVIDFIQNVRKPGFSKQYEMMSEIAKEFQRMAKQLKCCIIVLSQIPNSAGKEDSGILEFKGAGEIAAACDVGILLKRDKGRKEIVLVDVRKNRHGACGIHALEYANNWTRLEEVS
jgi:replicative DNA helicase